jgi:hypothetical protein
MYTSVRQTNRLRRRYLTAVLRQEVSFFDTQVCANGVVAGLQSREVVLVHCAAVDLAGGHFDYSAV